MEKLKLDTVIVGMEEHKRNGVIASESKYSEVWTVDNKVIRFLHRNMSDVGLKI